MLPDAGTYTYMIQQQVPTFIMQGTPIPHASLARFDKS